MSGPVLEEQPDIFGHSIFCDDIRNELDGKFTYVGVYASGHMLVRSQFPVVIPKFGIAIDFSQRPALFTTDLRVLIFLPGDPDDNASVEAEITGERPKTGDCPFIRMRANVVFAPLAIREPGIIKVRVLREGVLHRLGTLGVRPHPETAASNASEPPSE